MTLSSATTPNQSGPGSDVPEGVLRIPQNSSITGTLPSNCLVSYPDTHWWGGVTPLQRSSLCILKPQLIGQGNEGFLYILQVSRTCASPSDAA